MLFVQVGVMHVCVEHLRVVHVPQQSISLRVEDEVSPLEAAAVLLLLDVQEAAYTVQSVHVRHAAAITYHWDTQTDRYKSSQMDNERLNVKGVREGDRLIGQTGRCGG